MPQAVDNLTSTLEQISARLLELEHRVATLETRAVTLSGASSSRSEALAESKDPYPVDTASASDTRSSDMPLQRPRPPATWRGFPPVETPSGAIPVLGKAVLGIAGAYLLRALAESSSIPKLPVLFVAILYACFWMVWAVRIQAASRFASVTYAITSALILSPLLWESTVRFQVLSPAFAAAVTVAFVVLAIALAWRQDLQLIPWVATLASVITALALIIETHELVPLTAALLAVALITEAAACLGHRLTLRAIPALAADFAVWLLVFVLTSDTIPEGYHPTTASTLAILCSLLLAIYGASLGIRSFALRQRITLFEIAQAVAAFALTSYGVMHATHNSIAPALGVVFLLLAAVCYWGALARFTDHDQTRNRRVSATWAAALLLGGTFLLFPGNVQILFLSVAAAAATFTYTRTRKLSLGMHASVYLAAATAVSPLPIYVANALAREVPGSPGWRVWVVAIAAVVCYLLGSRVTKETRNRRLLWMIPAAVAGFSAAAVSVAAIVWVLAQRLELAASSLSVIRTIVNCGLALALAILGCRWKRAELGWLAYTAVAFGTLKLLFEDLRFGNAASLVVSLLFYGTILILLPRLGRNRDLPT
ncbi:MAG TPA: hypothetical protein VE377_04400 [Candidatus Dormibacteraeota bacterium]|nr:hypothetical protein [Candidatus Dormibacteraeota bacterium]